MATVSLSPTPISFAAMSSRRAPLTNNPNVANSPLRGSAALAGYAKQKRSYATIQREEPYGQAPPVKKQALDNGSQRLVRSPSKLPRQVPARGTATRLVPKDRPTKPTMTARNIQEADTEKEIWKKHHRAKFPKMVFYFESIPDDVRAKLIKKVTYLGARQEPFFSIDVTHVVTNRPVPSENPGNEEAPADGHGQDDRGLHDQPQTINPSLLDRNARRNLLYEFRQAPTPCQPLDDTNRRNKSTRNNDVLHKAREMGKKIWSLDKFNNMLTVLLESEALSATYGSKATAVRSQFGTSKGTKEPNLLQLLHNERINGPSDRDPTAVSRDLIYFKGPHIYIWDMDEKQKPVMVRDYPKVTSKQDGEWPQFRSVGNGRCPFVEELEIPERTCRKTQEREKPRAAKQDAAVPTLKAPNAAQPKPVTGKRSLAEMHNGHNTIRGMTTSETFNPAKAALTRKVEMRPQNAFISRAEGGKQLGGEPVASGMQPSNVTSAIRSQMISSTSGIHGAKAGTSKEIHGLQRKVLQRAAPASHDASSRRLADVSADVASSRSATISRQTSKVTAQAEDGSQKTIDGKDRKSSAQLLKSKKDLKPGYCENCQDKFPDFDEHILSRKHRKFAEDSENWVELDALLAQLSRVPRFTAMDSDVE